MHNNAAYKYPIALAKSGIHQNPLRQLPLPQIVRKASRSLLAAASQPTPKPKPLQSYHPRTHQTLLLTLHFQNLNLQIRVRPHQILITDLFRGEERLAA